MGAHRSSSARTSALVEDLGPGPWARAQILATGWSVGQLERAVLRGDLTRLRRGLYDLPPSEGVARQLAIPFDTRLARMRALARGLDARAAFSHDSAAHALGLWTPRQPGPVVHVTIPGSPDRLDAGLRVHSTALTDEFVTVVEGIRVTTVARTAADLARAGDLPAALVAMDGALRRLLSREIPDLDRRLRAGTVPRTDVARARSDLVHAAAPMRGWPGARTLAAAVAHADPASASPFESWSRGWMMAVGLPRPELNVAVTGASGRRWFGDFVWRERGLIGEADGVGKYGTTALEIRGALRAERERQADLEASGWRLVRWVTGDPGAQVVARLSRALYLDDARFPARILGKEA